MKVLIYDTETTGLIPKKCADLDRFPYVVQFSYIVYDTEQETIIKVYDEIISLPEWVEIPLEASNIHHILKEDCQRSQITIKECLEGFMEDCKQMDLVVGHNLEYDNTIVITELMRLKTKSTDEIQSTDETTTVDLTSDIDSIVNTIMTNEEIQMFKSLPFYCTMKETTLFCNILHKYKTGKTFVKFPKLIELHDILFGKDTLPIRLHNSLNDVLMCFRCFYKFKHNVDVLSKFSHLI